MTGHPEAVLARELALCYTSIALVTDSTRGCEAGEGVTQDEVFRVFAENTRPAAGRAAAGAAALPAERDCPCGRSLDGITLPFALP